MIRHLAPKRVNAWQPTAILMRCHLLHSAMLCRKQQPLRRRFVPPDMDEIVQHLHQHIETATAQVRADHVHQARLLTEHHLQRIAEIEYERDVYQASREEEAQQAVDEYAELEQEKDELEEAKEGDDGERCSPLSTTLDQALMLLILCDIAISSSRRLMREMSHFRPYARLGIWHVQA